MYDLFTTWEFFEDIYAFLNIWNLIYKDLKVGTLKFYFNFFLNLFSIRFHM